MPPTFPHSPSDLALAPVLINIENNLQMLRASTDVVFGLALTLNDLEDQYLLPRDRAERVLEAATVNVNLHGLTVRPTDDLHGLEVSHDGHRISLMLGKRLVDYVENGPPPTQMPDI